MTAKKEIVFLLVILAIASFFRLWKLDSIPPGLYPDVAINGNDALDSLKTGTFKVFYPENNGR
jgi:predicted membrane-bound mannosyltransferase